MNFLHGGDVHYCGEGIVRALAHIAVIVRVNGFFTAACASEDFVGAPGDNFVGVHVGLCAGAGLPYGERELVGQCAINDFLRGFDDGFTEVFVH